MAHLKGYGNPSHSRKSDGLGGHGSEEDFRLVFARNIEKAAAFILCFDMVECGNRILLKQWLKERFQVSIRRLWRNAGYEDIHPRAHTSLTMKGGKKFRSLSVAIG